MVGMKDAALRVIKNVGVAAVIAGAALFMISNGGCAARSTQMSAAGKSVARADTGQLPDETRQLVVTKHGPRHR